MILVDELATHEPNDLNVGLHWPPSKLAEALKEMCEPWGCPTEGVGDDAAGLDESLLQTLMNFGIYLRKPKKERVAGWQLMREYLTNAKEKNGKPGLWISERCEYFWKTVPYLQRCERRPEDILTTGPDHAGDACSVYGTLIHTPSGQREIQDLRVGDLVFTRNGPRPIEATGNRQEPTYIVSVSNGSEIEITPDHPVLVGDNWVPVVELQAGMMLTVPNGESLLTVISVSPTSRIETVYNIQVADDPEYYANGVLVHNCRYCVMNLDRRPINKRTVGMY